jgi:glyoxylase-like metal-dependent hydrolase (beta-lactamase superfamily II)
VFPASLDRRAFITDLGRGTLAIAVVSVAGCGPTATASLGPTGTPRASGATASPAGSAAGGSPPGGASDGPTPSEGSGGGATLTWERVNLGFVSAYILVRGGEAAIVDTGVAGSADSIGASLSGVGLGWDAVGHVILTHHHGDHAGSAVEVMTNAAAAIGYAGAEDIASIRAARTLEVAADGDEIFGLQVVTTPGHTAGSICVLDRTAGVLVAGDAVRVEGGAPALPGAQFTDDMDLAKASIVKLGALTFETLLAGHGDPIDAGASAMVAALGAAG